MLKSKIFSLFKSKKLKNYELTDALDKPQVK